MKGIEKHLARMSRKVRLARAMRGSAIGACAGAVIAVALAILDRFAVFYTSWELLLVCFGVAAVIGGALGALLRVDPLALADSVDRRLGLRNRLRTAAESKGGGDFDRAVAEDAAAKFEDAAKKNAFPLKFSRWHAAAVLTMALAAGIFLLGNSPIFLSEVEKKERAELKAAAAEIRRVARPLQEPPSSNAAEERELADRLEKLAKDLEKGRLSKKDALVKANELAEKAEKLARQRNAEANKTVLGAESLRQKALHKKLEEAGIRGADMQQVSQPREQLDRQQATLESEISALEERLAEDGMSEAERKSLESKLKDAKEALEQIKLSKKAQDFLDRLQSHPAFQELMELAAKLQEGTEGGGGEGKALTKEQIEEMIKKLEELADQLKDEEDLVAFIEELKKALLRAKKAGSCSGVCLLPIGLGFGNGAASKDSFFADTGRVPKSNQEKDITATTNARGVRGERAEQGTETHIEVTAPTAAGDRTKTPLTNVLPKYRKTAESAINKQQIPKSQQKRVREYFESLAGGK